MAAADGRDVAEGSSYAYWHAVVDQVQVPNFAWYNDGGLEPSATYGVMPDVREGAAAASGNIAVPLASTVAAAQPEEPAEEQVRGIRRLNPDAEPFVAGQADLVPLNVQAPPPLAPAELAHPIPILRHPYPICPQFASSTQHDLPEKKREVGRLQRSLQRVVRERNQLRAILDNTQTTNRALKEENRMLKQGIGGMKNFFQFREAVFKKALGKVLESHDLQTRETAGQDTQEVVSARAIATLTYSPILPQTPLHPRWRNAGWLPAGNGHTVPSIFDNGIIFNARRKQENLFMHKSFDDLRSNPWDASELPFETGRSSFFFQYSTTLYFLHTNTNGNEAPVLYQRLDKNTGKEWQKLTDLVQPRCEYGAALVGSTIIVAGGVRHDPVTGQATAITEVEMIRLRPKLEIQFLPDLPICLRAPCIVEDNTRIHLVGGIGGLDEKAPARQTDVRQIFSLDLKEADSGWSMSKLPCVPFALCTATILNGFMIVAGGIDRRSASCASNKVFVCKLNEYDGQGAGWWRQLPSLHFSGEGGTLLVDKSRLYHLFGQSYSSRSRRWQTRRAIEILEV